MMLEKQSHVDCAFITLTYDQNSVPEKLDYSDVSAFLKRYRRSTGSSVRFFCCGEYGSKFGRPHWHLILFQEWSLMHGGSCQLTQWPHGFAHVQSADPARMAYVARYALKSGPLGSANVVQMSRRPGLGKEGIIRVGKHLAFAQPKLDMVPHWLRVGRSLLPLDRTAYNWLENSYTAHGGQLLANKKGPAAYEFEAQLVCKLGDPCADPMEGVKLLFLDRKQNETAIF
jgi:hypothetical protein